jgi:hypothetical protein
MLQRYWKYSVSIYFLIKKKGSVQSVTPMYLIFMVMMPIPTFLIYFNTMPGIPTFASKEAIPSNKLAAPVITRRKTRLMPYFLLLASSVGDPAFCGPDGSNLRCCALGCDVCLANCWKFTSLPEKSAACVIRARMSKRKNPLPS